MGKLKTLADSQVKLTKPDPDKTTKPETKKEISDKIANKTLELKEGLVQDPTTTTPKGDTMVKEKIIYIKGSSKSDKAVYLIGKEKLPAVTVTRLLPELAKYSGPKLHRELYTGLQKFPAVLDAMDALEITPEDAVETFQRLYQENRPKTGGTGQRATKIEKIAEVVSKAICKKIKAGEPEEMVAKFLTLVNKEEFKEEAVDFIRVYKKQFGINNLGFIKTSERKGNPAAQKALAKARAAKGKSK